MPMLEDHRSSKSAKVRRTSISRLSTASRPASFHNARSTSIRAASALGGRATVAPKAANSTVNGAGGPSPRDPKICRDRAAWADHARHLGDALGRIGNEEEHKRHDSAIKPVGLEGQRHRVALKKRGFPQRRPSAGKRELRFGRIDPLYFGWRASLGEQLGERATAAADVDPSQARRWRQPIDEDVPSELAPDAH